MRLALVGLAALIAATLPASAQNDPGMVPIQLYTPANAPPGIDPLTQYVADANARFLVGAQARAVISTNLSMLATRTSTVEMVAAAFAPRIAVLEAKPDLTPRVVSLEARPIVPDLTNRVGALEARAPVPGPAGKDSVVPGPPGKDSTVPGPAGANGVGIKGDTGATGATGVGQTGATGAAGKDGASITGAAGPGYTSAIVNGAGHLIVTKTDGTTSDLGNVLGAAGAAGGVGATGSTGSAGRGIASSAVNAAGHLILTITEGTTADVGLVVGANGQTGAAGASITGAQGPAGIVPTYGPSGLITGQKCWQGYVTTTTGGAWTASYANTGFTAAPNVMIQAVSPSTALAGLLFATMTAPTATTVSGVTALAGIGGLGGAGAIVMVRACGI